MRIKEEELIEIIRAEGGTITAVDSGKARVAFRNHTVLIPLSNGGNKSSRWLDNFRRDVRRRRDTHPRNH